MTAAIASGQPDVTLTRRGLLAAGGASIAAAALADANQLAGLVARLEHPGTGAVAATATAVPAYLRRSTLAGLVGDRFELITGQGRATGRLVAVEELGRRRDARAAAPDEDGFALVFHTAGRVRLGQDVMSVSHHKLGAFPLLVSPSGTGRRGQDYAAIVNRASPKRRSGGSHVRRVHR